MVQQGDNYQSVTDEWAKESKQVGDMMVSPQEEVPTGKKTEALVNTVEQPQQVGHSDFTQPVIIDANPTQSNEVVKPHHQIFQMG